MATMNMNSKPDTKLKRKHVIAGLLALGVTTLVSLCLIRTSPQQRLAAVLHEAQRSGLVEHATMQVPLPNARQGTVHYWQPKSSATEVRFEYKGDRVLVRTVPKTQSPK